jgi:23S rRNA (cytosine1962-C5)-methyltransferase
VTPASDYELLDSGDGRKLERFGPHVLARPAAQAVWRPSLPPARWAQAHASFDREDGQRWHNRGALPESWVVSIDGLKFRLSGTDFGHLGIFPEQREQWRWIDGTIRAAAERTGSRPAVLNLFAYSGGSTIAALRAGAEVCHLDASRGMVQWARDNAALNELAGAPVRWITEDAHKYLGREERRGRRYDAVILDPPTFGRGAGGEVYKIERDLVRTLDLCRAVLTHEPLFMLLSGHTPGFSPVVLANVVRQVLRDAGGRIEQGEMLLAGGPDVAPLPNGTWARWVSAAAVG